VNGPLKLTAAYQKANGERVATAGSATTAATLGPIGASGELTTIGAVYNLGFASIGAGYQSEKANATSANTGTSALQFTKGEGYALTALFPMGAFTPYIKYGERKYSGGTLGKFTPTKMTNVGVRYALSKRTYVYGDYVQNGSDVIVPGATQLFNQGSLQNQTNFGITHAF